MISDKSKDIIAYREANPYMTLQAIATKHGLTRQRVFEILKEAGVTTNALKYEGMACHIRGVPKEIVEAMKIRAKGEGLTFRMKTIQLWEMYGKGLDK